jgi:outer membrane protein assembly factor BamB
VEIEQADRRDESRRDESQLTSDKGGRHMPASAVLFAARARIIGAFAATALLTGASLLAAPAATPHSAIEGKWLAPSVGSADNHTAAGLDIARNEKGELTVRAYVPIVNFYGLSLGVAEADGKARYVIRKEELELVLKGNDTLAVKGLIDDSVEMHRANELPAAPAQPDWPTGPGPRWRVRLGGAIFAPTAVRDGVAYVGNTDGVLFALKLTDGSPLWTFPAGRAIFGGALTTGDAVFFASDNGFLYKLDRSSGKELWRYDLGDARVSRIPPNPLVFDYDQHGPTPVLADDVIYIGAGDGGFHAIQAGSGERLWRIQSNAKIRASAAIHGAHVIFATMDGWVCAVDRGSGAEAWSFKKTTAFTSGPAIDGDVVVVGNRGSMLRGLDANTGAELWKQEYWGSWIESTAVFRDDYRNIGSGDLFLASSFDPKTGKNLWRTHVNGWVLQRPAVTATRVFVGVAGARRRNPALLHQSSALMALARDTGKILWTWPMPEWDGAFLSGFFAAPTVADGTILAGGVDGTLYAFSDQD